jgi:hypothetical protein
LRDGTDDDDQSPPRLRRGPGDVWRIEALDDAAYGDGADSSAQPPSPV